MGDRTLGLEAVCSILQYILRFAIKDQNCTFFFFFKRTHRVWKSEIFASPEVDLPPETDGV